MLTEVARRSEYECSEAGGAFSKYLVNQDQNRLKSPQEESNEESNDESSFPNYDENP